MSTREREGVPFDHGCQFLSGTDRRFVAALEAWDKANVVKPWDGQLVELDGSNISPDPVNVVRYVGVGGIQSVCRDLADSLDVRSNLEVKSLSKTESGWLLSDAEGVTIGRFDAIVVATPPIQAANLLHDTPDLAKIARSVPMSPCWTVMVTVPQSNLLPFDAAVIRNSPLSWIARSRSQNFSTDTANSWVLQASADWSHQHLEDSKTAVEDALLKAFFTATGCSVQTPTYIAAHRWRYAICTRPLAAGHLIDAASHVAVCGDWCLGINAEAACLSGLTAADELVRTIHDRPV
jgi:hypothetical protein